MRRLVDVAVGIVVPERCLHCRGPAGTPGSLLCAPCRAALPWLPADTCPRCGLPAPCARSRCSARRAPFAAAWAPLAYEGPARSLVLAAKDRSARRVAPWFAAAMVARAPTGLLRDLTAVVPVPGDPARRRRRGEDHALLLARSVGRATGLPVLPVLVRRRSEPAQHLRDRTARARIPAPLVIGAAPERVLLVDDVHTSGATLRAAAGALRAAGATRVCALTALRTLR